MKTAKNLLKKATACGMVLILFVLFLAAASPQKVYAGDGYTLSKYKVKVKHGYLALRSKKTFKRSNEIGKLYTGDSLIHCPTDSENSTYWYVYSPKLNKLGYVNRNYLRYYKEYTGDIDYYVKVKKGYLALRNAKAYKRSNETGKMYKLRRCDRAPQEQEYRLLDRLFAGSGEGRIH